MNEPVIDVPAFEATTVELRCDGEYLGTLIYRDATGRYAATFGPLEWLEPVYRQSIAAGLTVVDRNDPEHRNHA